MSEEVKQLLQSIGIGMGMVLLTIIALLFIGNTEVKFDPFSIRMPGWKNVIAIILCGIGLLFFHLDSWEKGYRKAEEDFIKIISEVNNEAADELTKINEEN